MAFYECTRLTSVTLPEGLTSMGNGAFQKCSRLTSVVFPSTLTTIGNGAFSGCKGLTSVDLSSTSLTSIGSKAFRGCKGLASVELPSSLTSIGEGAFSGCTGLTSVDLSQTSLTRIENATFMHCWGLTSVIFPEGLASIGWIAFLACSGLTSVTFPDSLTSIGVRAFEDCASLASVVFPSTRALQIRVDAFAECTALSVIVHPCQVHPDAFPDCRLVLNASGNAINNSTVIDPRIIELRQRLLVIWSQNVRRQGKMRQTSKSYRMNNTGVMQGFVDMQSKRERPGVLYIWTEIKQLLVGVPRRDEVVEFLFAEIIEGGRRLVRMKSYLNQPKETKVFKKVFDDLGITEPRRYRSWKGRLESQFKAQLRF